MNRPKITIMTAILAISAIVGIAFFISNDTEKIDSTDKTVITYRYTDSSVPPRYHRSYTVTVEKTTLHIVVDSYGDILKDETYSISKEEYQHIIDTYNDAKISKSTTTELEVNCAGGTSDSLLITQEGKEILNETNGSCGERKMTGDVKSLVDAIMELVPFVPADIELL